MAVNEQKLRQAEALFLQRYPGGFSDPEMATVMKKHNIAKLSEFARQNLAPEVFNRPEHIADTVLKIVSRSSMVSRFEKPAFRDFITGLNSYEKQALADAVEKRLYGRQKAQGFNELLGMLGPYKLAKWSVISVVPFYFSPTTEAFVKPTTAKGILALLEVDDFAYRPAPSWEFYRAYRSLLAEVKDQVVPTLSPNYAALSGFLMMSI
jgi:hypothetical protein